MLKNKKTTHVFIGNFGSGKSELALNAALNARGQVSFVDLDIVNPYFRSSDLEQLLSDKGITVHKPVFARSGVEVPSLPPDIYSVFIDNSETVVFDVGGDPTGAVALGQYKANFDALSSLEVLYVINTRRPLSSDAASILDMMENISRISRLSVTGLINNSNLSNTTSVEDLLHGYGVVAEVSSKSGIPVSYTAGQPEVLSDFVKNAKERGLANEYIGKSMPISRYMRRDWERFGAK